MNILPGAVGNVLHREIKRLLVQVECVEDKADSIQEIQNGEMVQVRRRLEKLEMDSEDIQEALRGCLGERNSTSDTLVSFPLGRWRKGFEFSPADKGKADEETREDSTRLGGVQNTELADALEGISRRMESLENRVNRIWNQQLTLQEEIGWLKREYVVLGTKHKKELNELQLLVRTPEPSTKTSQERQLEIPIEEQPVVQAEDGCEISNTARFHEEGWILPEGISKMDHLQDVGLSLSNVMASVKSKTEGPGTSTLPGTLPKMSSFDLDFRSNMNKDTAENKAPEDRKINMDIDTRADDDLSTTLSVEADARGIIPFYNIHKIQDANQLLSTRTFFHESKKGEDEFDQPAGGCSAVQQHMHSHSHENKELEEDGSNAQDHADERPGDSSPYQGLKSWGLRSNVAAARTDIIPKSPLADYSGKVSLDPVEDENAAKTHKVLEAYEIDVVVKL